ncbi:SBBP repeat-containing protein [Elusimicrobiota bacterium]
MHAARYEAEWTAAAPPAGLARGLVIDGSGNTYVVGTSGGKIWVGGYNSSGVLAWSDNTVTGTGRGIHFSGATVYVAGDSGGKVWWRKYNTSGGLLGTITTPPLDIIGHGIVADGSGNFYVAGQNEGINNGDTWVKRYLTGFNDVEDIGTSSIDSAQAVALSGTALYAAGYGGSNIWIRKYTASSGSKFWTVSNIAGKLWGIDADASGNVYVTGENAAGDMIVRKHDSAGAPLWATSHVSIANDAGYDIVVDNAGKFYVAGEFDGSFWVSAYNAAGTWVATIRGSGASVAYGIDADSAGNIYVAGESGGNIWVRKYKRVGWIWDGGGADNLASTAENWLDDTVPAGTAVYIDLDATSSKNMTWDLTGITVKNFIIASGYGGTVTLGANMVTSGNVTINAATFLQGAYTLTVGGNLTVTNSVYNQNTNNLSVTGSLIMSGSTFVQGNNTLTVNGGFTMTGSNFTQGNGAFSVTNGFTMTNSNFTQADNTFTVNGNFTMNGTNFYKGDNDVTVTGTLSLTSGDFYQGDNTFSVGGFSESGGRFFQGAEDVVVVGDFTMSGGIFARSTDDLYVGGNLSITGTSDFSDQDGETIMNNSGTISVTSPDNSPASLRVAGTVLIGSDLDLSGALTVESGSFDFTDGYTCKVARNFIHSGGTFQPSTGTIEMDGGTAQTIAIQNNNSFYSLKIEGSGVRPASTMALAVDGDFSASAGYFYLEDSSVTIGGNLDISANGHFNGGLGEVEMSGGGDSRIGITPGDSIYNLKINKDLVSETVFASSDLNIDGDLTITQGIFNAEDSTHTIAGDFSQNGGVFTPASGMIILDGSAQQGILTQTNNYFHNLSLRSSSNVVTQAPLVVAGNKFEVYSSTFEAAHSVTVNAETFDVTGFGGWIDPKTSTFEFSRTSSSQTIGAASVVPARFYNLDIANTNHNVTMEGEAVVEVGNVLTIDANATLKILGGVSSAPIVKLTACPSLSGTLFISTSGPNVEIKSMGSSAYFPFDLTGGSVEIDGLTLDGVDTNGFIIADAVTITKLRNVTYQNFEPGARMLTIESTGKGGSENFDFYRHTFADSSLSVNVSAPSLSPSLGSADDTIVMAGSLGYGAGPNYEDDPNNAVFWFHPPAFGFFSGTALGVSSVQWSWSAGSDVNSYRVTDAANTQKQLVSSDTLHWDEASLNINTAYSRKVIAVSPVGNVTSNLVTAYTAAAAPINFTSNNNVYITSAAFTWDDNGNPSQTRFRVSYWFPGSSTGTLTTTDTSAAITDLLGGSTYAFRLESLNEDNVATRAGSDLSIAMNPFGEVLSSGGTSLTVNAPSGQINISVPSGALSNNTNVRIEIPSVFPSASVSGGSGASPVGVGVKIISSGQTQLLRTATIIVTYQDSDVAGLDESKLILARYADPQQVWVPLESTVDEVNNRVQGKTNHFSTFQIMQAQAVSSLNHVIAFPNPAKPSRGEHITFSGLPAAADISIYTYLGEFVKTLKTSNTGTVVWDCLTASSMKAASGVYLAMIESGGKRRIIKVAIER